MTTSAQPASTLAQTALALHAGGLSLIPVDARDKRPLAAFLPRYCPWPKDPDLDNERGRPTWKTFQQVRATPDLLTYWTVRGAQIAVVCGAISGGLEIIDIDRPHLYTPLLDALGPLAAHLPIQQTGGGGYQIAYRRPSPGHNDKLAYVPDASKFDGRSIAIETRGEGGYAIVYPSRHPSGNHYRLLQGDWAAIPTLGQDQADHILSAARSLCEAPYTTQQIQAMQHAMQPTPVHSPAPGTIITHYNANTSIEDELRRQGYRHCYGNRWSPPGAGRRDSVEVKNGKARHWDSDFPLADGYWHDAFDIYKYYEQQDDTRAAIKAAATLLCIPQRGMNA